MKLDVMLAGDMDEEAILDVLNGNYAFAGAKEPDGFLAQVHQEMLWEIDTWIDSGRNPDETESPKQRTLAPRAWDEARAYFEHYAKLQLVPEKPPTGPQTLPQLRLSPKLNTSWGTLEARTRNGGIVAIVLLSDLQFRLAKCRYRRCGRYFLLPRVREKPYKNGLFCCPGHNQKEAATKSTNEGRKRADGLLLDCAAEELLRHRGEQSVRVKKEVLAALNTTIDRDPNLKTHAPVKINFVTRHWQQIQKRAEELLPLLDCAALVLLQHLGKQSATVKKEMLAALNEVICGSPNLKSHAPVKINFVTRHRHEILKRAQELFVTFTQLRAIHSKANIELT